MTRLTGDTDSGRQDGSSEQATPERERYTDGGVSSQAATSTEERADSEGDAPAGEAVEESDADAAPEEPLSLDVVFEIAKNERRRLVLQYLGEHEGPVPIGDLAEHIAALENDKEVRELTSTERKRVYVGLYQCHLPKMDGAGVVDFDRNAGVTLGPAAPQVMEYIDTDDGRWRWNRYYLAVSLLGAGLLGTAAATGAGAMASFVGAGVTAVLLLVAAVHTYVDER